MLAQMFRLLLPCLRRQEAVSEISLLKITAKLLLYDLDSRTLWVFAADFILLWFESIQVTHKDLGLIPD